ncbi:MAG: ABC transporter permease [Desulfovibrionaceae bacterium]|nr:ABC transporter permease [Desulfovibrionaceae bacterium]
MLKHFAVKIIWLLFVLWGVSLISFAVIHLAPGSPTDLQTTLNPMAGEAARARLEAIYGTNRPILVQYWDWLIRIIQLDFGNSMSADARPVIEKICERLPLTVSLNVISMGLTFFLAIPIGILSAWKRDTLFDRIITIFCFIGFAMPGFWLCLLLMQHMGLEHNWLPLSGIVSLNFHDMTFPEQIADLCAHAFLPVLVTVISGVASVSRYMRASMIHVLEKPYILTAISKGIPTRTILFHHALRNALLPVITLIGLSIPGLIGGSVIIENVFALPGLGQLFYSAVMARDYPLIMGNLILGAVLTLLGSLLADLGYTLADPRIRKTEGL